MTLEAGEPREVGRSHVIKRPRLTRLLDETDARIILLIAPAGYGKTTLAREWLADRPHGWYRGSPASSDVAALALGLARAASRVVPNADERLRSRLRVSKAPSEEVEDLAELLAQDLAPWPAGAWLGFDDYQFACDSEPAERLVEHLTVTGEIQLLVATRTRPRWAPVRRTLYGETFEIGRALLAMNEDEGRRVLGESTTRDAGGLLTIADGWPALIGLATLAGSAVVPGEAVPEELYSFFAEELYHEATPDLQQGLRRLSLAPYVSRDIADIVLGRQAGDFVERGIELGFFIIGREPLELHPLLRSFLASKFRKRSDDPDGRVLAGLAQVLIEDEEWDAVFELASRFAEDGVLVTLLEASLRQMLDQARMPTLSAWIDVAKARRIDSPVVDFAEAELSFRRGELDKAEALGCQAARRFTIESGLRTRALWIAGTSAHLANRDEASFGHYKDAEDAAHSDDDVRQALWGQFLAAESLERAAEAQNLLTSLIERSSTTADELLRIATGRIRLALLCGGVREAAQELQALTHLSDRSRDPLIRSSFLNSYASVLGLCGRYEEALLASEHEIEFIKNAALDFVLPYAYLNKAIACFGLRQLRTATACLARCERAMMKSDFLNSNVSVAYARIRLAAGRPHEAIRALDQAYELAKSCQPAHAEHLAWSSLARAVAGDRRDARRHANLAESLSRRVEVSALVPWTRAVLESNRSRDQGAAATAFDIALESGNIDACVTAYRAHPQLLELLANYESGLESLKEVLDQARDHSLAARVGIHLTPTRETQGLGNLSRREHEVLDLVSQGLMNKEIARTLFITEATVKVHVRKICQKLGVRSRTEAAMRAAEFSD